MEENQIKELNLWQRIHYAGTMLNKRVPKDKQNKFDGYDYSSHDGVVAFVRASLQEARLLLTIEPGQFDTDVLETDTQKGKKIVFQTTGLMQAVLRNIDKPEETHAIPVPVMALDRGDKGHGKAISYGKKYAITACIGLLLATGEDTDADSPDIGDGTDKAAEARYKAKEEKQMAALLQEAKKELDDLRKAKKMTVEALKDYALQQTGREIGQLDAVEIKTLTAKLEAWTESKTGEDLI